ncbi:MAG: LacI family transcriptional regulator [Treponema sp.]|jgi:LacI family transcriptional regulator|nr:LacI family transcriptional regulator [Treponema sp.]
MKLTINEIAKMANVAKSTVSKAINGQKGVSEANRQRILEIIQQVNFQPNASARALAQNKTGAIGIVLPHDALFSLSGAYWAAIVSAIAAEANKQNNTLMVISPQEGEKLKFESFERILKSHGVDGLIIGAEQIESQTIMNVMIQEIPFVFIGKNPFIEHFAVDVNNKDGAFCVVEQLITRGHKKIGCIAGPEHYDYTIERIKGFKEALEKSELDNTKIAYSSYSKEDTIKTASAFFEKNNDIDALFLAAGGDFVLNIMEVLRLSGKDPKSIGLGVFDDSRIFDFLDWPIVTARQPIEKMGTYAAKMLLSIINGMMPEEKLKYFDVEIVLR